MSKETTKTAIAQSLYELLCQKTFDKISIDRVCEAAQISRRNFYRHFPDKYALLNWLYYEKYFSRIKIPENGDAWDYLMPMCVQFHEDKSFFRNALSVRGQNSLRYYFLELIYPQAEIDLKLKSKRTPDKIYKLYFSKLMELMYECVFEWLKSNPAVPPDSFAINLRKHLAAYSKHTWDTASARVQPPEGEGKD